jgi:hypothetical protein
VDGHLAVVEQVEEVEGGHADRQGEQKQDGQLERRGQDLERMARRAAHDRAIASQAAKRGQTHLPDEWLELVLVADLLPDAGAVAQKALDQRRRLAAGVAS